MAGSATGSQRAVGSASEPCPLKKSSILVQVMRSDTNEFVGGATVKVDGPTPGSAQTSPGTGTTRFDGVTAGSYSVEISLTGPQWQKFRIDKSKRISVPASCETPVLMQIAPPGALHVQVIRSDTAEVLQEAKVRATGPDSLPEKSLSAEGWAVYDEVLPGAYSISVVLPDQLAGKFKTPPERRATVPDGSATKLSIAVDPDQVCWIELELLDGTGKGIGQDPYWIRLPNGDVREGKLDDKGFVRLNKIPCGNCTVRFPSIGEEEAQLQTSGEEGTGWVEILLVDEDNKPVGEEPYRVQFIDGSIKEGTLDKNGHALLTGVKPGNCTVRFPSRDAAEFV